jgi:hypothetical protein
MNKYGYIFVLLLLTACMPQNDPEILKPSVKSTQEPAVPGETTTPEPLTTLKDYGTAPELANEVWLNVDEPLRLADLRGQVVLLDMWTFG